MSMEHEEYQRDEEMLERRRMKRLEMKRKRQMQQRIILGAFAVLLILIIVLIARGCSSNEPAELPEDVVTPPVEEPVQEVEVDPDTTATLAAVGDIMMYDSNIAAGLQEDQTYDFSAFFEAISPYTISPDLTVGNLELNMLGTGPYVGNTQTDPYFNAPEALAANLSAIGFDILQTANTYSIMNGTKGLQSTIDVLNKNSIDHVGTHASDPDQSPSGGVVLREVNGIKIAFIGFTKGVNNMALPANNKYAVDLLYVDYNSTYEQVDATGILKRVEAAKATDADVIVAMVHWGSEYDLEISQTQTEIRNLLFKNGVDVILGSHPHVVGPMEMVDVETTDGEQKKCFVAYSLGNFLSDMEKDYTMESCILNLEFTKSGETSKTTITDVSYMPVYILDRGEGAETRFEVLPIRNAIKSDLFQAYEADMTAAIEHLKENTQMPAEDGSTVSAVNYDSGT